MRRLLIGMAVFAIVATAMPARAQDDGGDEIIVTAMRRLDPDDEDGDRAKEKPVQTPAAVQTLRRTADFAIQQVVIVSDTIRNSEPGPLDSVRSLHDRRRGTQAESGKRKKESPRLRDPAMPAKGLQVARRLFRDPYVQLAVVHESIIRCKDWLSLPHFS